MAEISASTVMKLRKMSGQGMMDCKKALSESGGDLDAAMEILKKKGLATMAKRAARETTEGRVVLCACEDGKAAAMATLCCETDFVSKSDDFIALADAMKKYMCNCPSDQGGEELADTEVDGKKFSDMITDTVSKTGEKTEVGDFARYKIEGSGIIGSYVHFNNKLGAMVRISADNDDVAAAVKDVANDICMHITAMNPVAANRDSVPSDVIEKEREAAREQVKNKPENIVDKIVEGKLGKFFAENCLVDQDFVKDDSKTVGQALSEAAKAAGGNAKVEAFVRFEIGG